MLYRTLFPRAFNSGQEYHRLFRLWCARAYRGLPFMVRYLKASRRRFNRDSASPDRDLPIILVLYSRESCASSMQNVIRNGLIDIK